MAVVTLMSTSSWLELENKVHSDHMINHVTFAIPDCVIFTGPGGISCFIVEKDSPGLSFGQKERKVTYFISCS